MANQSTRKREKGSTRTGRTVTGVGSSKTANPIGVADASLGTEGITWGSVNSYAVDSDRLMIKLNAGAINHPLISVGADAPHFRSAVSMAMLAYHTPGVKLTVRYFKPNRRQGLSGLDIWTGLEVAIGAEPDEALAFEDWPINLPS